MTAAVLTAHLASASWAAASSMTEEPQAFNIAVSKGSAAGFVPLTHSLLQRQTILRSCRRARR
jgi:hypothetical protein